MRIKFLVLCSVLFLAGCKEENVPTPQSTPASQTKTAPPQRREVNGLPARAENGTPQPKLPTIKLWVGTNEISGEIASTLHQIQTGMMWRTNMAEMDGMLFVMPGAPQHVSFYMRNTLVPLSCAYIDSQGTILEIYDMKPRDETPIPSTSDQVQYVLEMNQGWFERHAVRPGMLMRTQYGSFPETFTRRQR